MTDVGVGEQTPGKQYTRRDFLRGTAKTVKKGVEIAAVLSPLGKLVLAASASTPQSQQPQTQEHSQPPARPIQELPVDISAFEKIMDDEADKRTPTDVAMFSDRDPGIDLTYFNNETINSIRSEPVALNRILRAVGFLDVEKSKRYSWVRKNGETVYACNIYTRDLLRLLLGNADIGSRYNVSSGAPTVFGLDQAKEADKQELNDFNKVNLELNSNNLDWWMQKYGRDKYHWEQALTQKDLQDKLKQGYIGMGASKNELVKPGFIGHAFVVFDLGAGIGLTQATNNIRLAGYQYGSMNQKVQPDNNQAYHFWVHKLPPRTLPLPLSH